VAYSNYSWHEESPRWALKRADLLHHLHLLGPTVSGKSKLIESSGYPGCLSW